MLLPFTALIIAVLLPFSTLPAGLLLISFFSMGIHKSIRAAGHLSFLNLFMMFFLPTTLIWSLAPGISIGTLGALLCLPLSWIAGLRLSNRMQLDGFLSTAVNLLLFGFILWGVLQGPNTFTTKPQGPFNDPNTFASAIILLALPVVADYLSRDLSITTSWQRVFPVTLLGGAFLVFLLVASRGAFLALILAAPALLYAARNTPQLGRKLLVLCVVLFASGILVSNAIPVNRSSEGGLAGRLIETARSGDPPRLMLATSAWHMIEEEPWIGRGLGSFPLEYAKYRDPEEKFSAGGWVHNDFLQLWLEGGLPVILVYLGLLAYTINHIRLLIAHDSSNHLKEIGYATGIIAAFIHASVNFIFYFSLISLLLGFYFARITPLSEKIAVITNHPPRALRMSALAYMAFLGYMFTATAAVDIFLGKSAWIQRQLTSIGVTYPRYQVAYWLSVLAPWQPGPHHVMAVELLDAYRWTGSANQAILASAINRMDAALKWAPCYTKFINNKLAVAWSIRNDKALAKQGMELVYYSLSCNPAHGLSHYYAGTHAQLQDNTLEAMRWWYSGLVLSRSFQEQLLLISATLKTAHPEWSDRLQPLIKRLELAQHLTENNPGIARDAELQNEAELLISALTGKNFSQLRAELRYSITSPSLALVSVGPSPSHQ